MVQACDCQFGKSLRAVVLSAAVGFHSSRLFPGNSSGTSPTIILALDGVDVLYPPQNYEIFPSVQA